MSLSACAAEGTDADTSRVGEPAVVIPAAGESARKAAALTHELATNPRGADSILAAAGHTRQSFDALMYEIAADSALSAIYAREVTPP